ncbi:MAG: RluA family pseudouridine synthase [Clostridiales bacterium]|nr:RluA family pseudouridine synthase [Clostridiales bacterium]
MRKEAVYPVEAPALLLDFLLAHISGQSRNSVKHLLSRGQILVDGRPQTRFDVPLSAGQQVTVLPQSKGPAIPFPVLYEDDGLIAVCKPAGLLSVATEREKQRTAYRMVSDCLKGRDPASRIFVVHRLDRDTSGVLLFAKDESLKHQLQDNWNTLVKRRNYYAAAEGDGLPDEGTCRSFLRENRVHKVYSSKAPGGREAVTHYHVLARRNGYALLDISLGTGRKNQIRAHLSELGHPVAGDEKYGAAADPMGRLALHAYDLTLLDPRSGELLSITASAPQCFRRMFPGRL